MSKSESKSNASPNKKRTYLKQADVPSASLDYALRVPQAIVDNFAGSATSPFNVAKALELDPKGSQFRVITGAAIAFGLVEGGAQAESIALTPLAKKIVRPLEEGEDQEARKEALLKPRIFGDFLRTYDEHTFPRDDIAENVLVEMGVPQDKAKAVRERIETSARAMGFIEEIRGKRYVHLGARSQEPHEHDEPDGEDVDDNEEEDGAGAGVGVESEVPNDTDSESADSDRHGADQRARRVFITHGKSKKFLEAIKKLLGFGELTAVVSVEKQSVSKPVPDKVMEDMRSCGAAIIHVDAERVVHDEESNQLTLVNENVLIEIGAAMALYGRRFILLVHESVTLPSNLQGLYEVRYSSDNLDGDATIRLLEAINDIKNNPMPERYKNASQQSH